MSIGKRFKRFSYYCRIGGFLIVFRTTEWESCNFGYVESDVGSNLAEKLVNELSKRNTTNNIRLWELKV